MRPIILDIHELSDSKEVYESKPHIFFSLFIYLILAIIMISLIWMYFGSIDVVVQSEGVLRPNQEVSTIVNEYGGKIEKVYIEDGDNVNEGDILYTIEHKDLITEQEYYQALLNDVNDRISNLQIYKKSVQKGVNYFDKEDGEEFYIKFENYNLNLGATDQEIQYSKEERELNEKTITKQLEDTRVKRELTEKLKQSVSQNTNLLSVNSSEQEFYHLYHKYISDYTSIKDQYAAKKAEINASTTKEGTIDNLEYNNTILDGMLLLKKSIKNSKNYFSKTDTYELQYKEYLSKIESLTNAYNEAKETYEINLELEDYGVSKSKVNKSKQNMEDAKKTINDYKNSYLANVEGKITEINKIIKDLKLTNQSTITKDELYSQNDENCKKALENFKLEYMVNLDAKLDEYNESIKGYEANLENLNLQKNKNYIYKNADNDERSGSLVQLKNTELQNTISEINTYNEKKDELETNLTKIEKQIENAMVTAKQSGVVNSSIDLVTGDTLAAGTEVLTIIPTDNSLYKVNIYVNNEDIAKIKKGMKVKFNIYALPNKEYGYVIGTITKISKDIKIDESNSSSYYLVEASLENRKLYDSNGEEGRLKVGMKCQSKIITGKKKILNFVLEKINLLD